MSEQSSPNYNELWQQQRHFQSLAHEANPEQGAVSESHLDHLIELTTIRDRELLEGLVKIAREETTDYEQRHGQTPTIVELRTRILARSNNKEAPTKDETLAAQAINSVVDPKTKVASITLRMLITDDHIVDRAKQFLTEDLLSEASFNVDEVA